MPCSKIGRALRPRAGIPATALFLAGLALAPLGARLIGPAQAQSVANPNDQPTASTLPAGTSTVRANPAAAHRPNGDVAPPRALKPATSVVGSGGRVNPEDHLPASMRRGG